MFARLVFLAIFGFMLSCSDGPADLTMAAQDSTTLNKIEITDRSGQKWDISFAVKEYHWSKQNFLYGLGMNTVPAILNPEFVSAGQAGFPDSSNNFMVLGVEIDRDTRAYPLYVLKSREVVNDRFGQKYVAVSY